jgi:hypothetical protein
VGITLSTQRAALATSLQRFWCSGGVTMTASPKRGEMVDQQGTGASNLEKDPEDWVSGDDPMTAAQSSYLHTLCAEAGEEFEPKLSKAEASKRIDALREKTGKNRSA